MQSEDKTFNRLIRPTFEELAGKIAELKRNNSSLRKDEFSGVDILIQSNHWSLEEYDKEWHIRVCG